LGTVIGAFYDPTHPRARTFIWNEVKLNYYDKAQT